MKPILLLLLVFFSSGAWAQTPFSTYKTSGFIAPRAVEPRGNTLPPEERRTLLQRVREANNNLKDSFSLQYFDHMSANVVFIQNSQQMFPTINGEIINYKLGVWTQRIFKSNPKECDTCGNITDRVRRRACKIARRECRDLLTDSLRVHYLPFSIITKVSSNYNDSSAGPTHDATSFFGAPLTFRFSPAIDLTPGLEDNKLFAGMNADLRLLTYTDSGSTRLQTAWGAYVSVGLSYLGKGYAYDTDDAQRHDGRFSFSSILYWFKSGGEFNKALFGDYQKKSLTGIELMLRFKTSSKQDSKFNFLFGANNCFTRGAPGFAQWQFQLGIGT